MYSQKKLSKIVILSFCAICDSTQATSSLCSSADTVIFSCSTSKSKSVALCMNNHPQTITYRFGSPGKIEMSYVATASNGNDFLYNHYFRPRVEYTRISFIKSDYKYSIFRNYDATESPVPRYGVAVSRNEGDEVQIKCQSKVVDNMSKLLDRLKCDDSSALGCS
jgi:hypothetical protein